MDGGFLWSANARQPGCIEHDYAFISDRQLNAAPGSDFDRQPYDRLGKLARVIDVRNIGLADEL